MSFIWQIYFLLIDAFLFKNSFTESAWSRVFTEINQVDIYLVKYKIENSKVMFETWSMLRWKHCVHSAK